MSLTCKCAMALNMWRLLSHSMLLSTSSAQTVKSSITLCLCVWLRYIFNPELRVITGSSENLHF